MFHIAINMYNSTINNKKKDKQQCSSNTILLTENGIVKGRATDGVTEIHKMG